MSFINLKVRGKVKSARLQAEDPAWPNLDGTAIETTDGPFTKGAEEMVPGETGLDAQMEARLQQAKQEGFQEGFQIGLEEGKKRGLEEARREYKPLLSMLDRAVQELKAEKETFYEENEVYIVKLAIEIARKIIQRELNQNADILLYIVREALRKVAGNGKIVIRVHPEDLELLQKNRDFLEQQLSTFSSVEFVPSEDVEKGGCVIESESGIVDAQLSVQLEQIEEALLEGARAE